MALFNHFFGLMDMKTGVIIITIYALLNKVSGIYGVFSILDLDETGDTNDNVLQLIMYIYSIIIAGLFAYFLSGVVQENVTKLRLYKYVYAIDVFINTVFLGIFSTHWYTTPRESRGKSSPRLSTMDNMNITSSNDPWHQETPFTVIILVFTIIIKLYFLLCIVSFYKYLCHQRTFTSVPRHSNTIMKDLVTLIKQAVTDIKETILTKTTTRTTTIGG